LWWSRVAAAHFLDCQCARSSVGPASLNAKRVAGIFPKCFSTKFGAAMHFRRDVILHAYAKQNLLSCLKWIASFNFSPHKKRIATSSPSTIDFFLKQPNIYIFCPPCTSLSVFTMGFSDFVSDAGLTGTLCPLFNSPHILTMTLSS
jgi:hypothetical protein